MSPFQKKKTQAITPLLKHLVTSYPERNPKIVAFADGLTSAGRLSKLRSWTNVPILSKTRQDNINL